MPITYSVKKTLEVEIDPSDVAYAANDCVGGLLTLGPVPGAAGGGLSIKAISLADEDNEGAELKVIIFDQAPSDIADQAPLSLTYADLKKINAVVTIAAADYAAVNSMKHAYKSGLDIKINSPKFWVYLATTGTPTYAATKKLYLRFFTEL